MNKLLKPIRPINCGQDGAIWLADNGLAVKVHHMGSKKTEEEYKVALDLYNHQVSVPSPQGLFRILISGEERLGFGMEYIRESVAGYMSNEAEAPMLEEIEKVKKLGYFPRDIYFRQNCLWVPKEKKVYLIDFVGWKKLGERK